MIRVPVTEVHEIELTSRCNLACVYCPHPKLERPKRDMEWMTYLRALEHVSYYLDQGTQRELSLTGIGEAILYPRLEEALRLARAVMGDKAIVLATNGVAMTEEIAGWLARYQIFVYVSLHRPEAAGPAIQMLKAAGAMGETNDKFVTLAFDWAGQVEWYNTMQPGDCHYLRNAWAVVREDGAVNPCCWDAHGTGKIAHVDDELGSFTTHPISLCGQCAFRVPRSYIQEAP